MKRDVLDGILEPEESRESLVCPGCGATIPEGMMYCETCGEEIHFVPEFEPEVDDSIAVAMNNVASEIAAQAEEAPKKKAFIRREDTAGDPCFEFHIRFPKRALRYLGVVLVAAAVVAVAVTAIPQIMTLTIFDRDSKAHEQKTQVSFQTTPENDPAAAAPQKEHSEVKAENTPAVPRLEPASGQYESALTVTLANAQKGVRYYYTLDGSQPSESAVRYLEPIMLSEEGEVTIRVLALSEDGTAKNEASYVYQLEAAGPAAPVILEDSGEYTQSTMIVVVSQEDSRITYTTDGSDPTPDSLVYTAPIKMPVGTSEFRFCAFDEDGNSSEIVDRMYHLVYARLVSEEQATASVIRVLVDKNVLADQTGRVFGGEGYNMYRVESVIEIEGAGEYYRIVETFVSPDGSSTDTGLLYAVNTNDGSVHRLGYDSSGKYTLFTLAGR